MAPPMQLRESRARRSVTAVLVVAAAVAATMALSVVLFAERAPARSRPDGTRLVQLNICGHVCNKGRPVPGVLDAIADYRPGAASLDEVCRGQLRAVVSGLRRRGWPMHARFLVTARGVCGGDDYGIAVLTRSRVAYTDTVTYDAQAPGALERRGLLCVRVALGGRPTRVCGTHLVSAGEDRSGAIRRAQVAEATGVTGSSDGPVVLMGDLNLPPADASLSPLYSSLDEVGQGQQGCRCGVATHSSGDKLDYVFVSGRDFTVADATVVASAFSDHDVLRAVVTARGTT
jgi:endonuclease/exonuclease/phosphatase family metal-dependent hydrolase